MKHMVGLSTTGLTNPSGDARPVVNPAPIGGEALLSLIARITHARVMEEAWLASVEAFRLLGFVHVIYGYSPDSRGTDLGAREDFLLLSTLDRQHMDCLVTREHHRSSVTFNWALSNEGVVSWSAQPSEALGRTDFQPTDEALAFFDRVGLVSGCSVGFAKTRTRGIAAMALAVDRNLPQDAFDAVLPELSESIHLLATVAHRSLIGLPWHRPSGSLTARQREVLEWVGEGKTTADIACIMGLKPATVEKHLRLARQCLGVETTAHALIKAAFLNQVYVRGDGRGDQG